MKTKQLSSKQLIALVLILIGAVSSIFGITGLTKSSSEDPYESRNGIVMVYATVYDNEGNSEAGMGNRLGHRHARTADSVHRDKRACRQ